MRKPILLTAVALVVLSLAGSGITTYSSARGIGLSRSAGLASVPGQGAPVFSSAYTGLTNCPSGMTKAEEKEAEEHGSDLPSRCKGLGGYVVYISYSA